MNIFTRKSIIGIVACFMLAGGLASAKLEISKNVGGDSKVLSTDSFETMSSVKQSKLNFCGDGVVDIDGVDAISGTFDDEQCDDGNMISGDGCSSICRIESLECVELFEINFDFNQDGFSDIADIIVAQNIILGRTSISDDGSCDDRFVSIGYNDEGVCCPEGVICDISCNGRLSSHDLVLMSRVLLGVYEGDVCGVAVCEEVVDTGSVAIESINLSNVTTQACTDNIDVSKFEVKNNGDVDIKVEGFKVEMILTPELVDISNQITGLRLRRYNQQLFIYELLDEKPVSSVVSNTIVFDGFSVLLGQRDSTEFLVTVDGNSTAPITDYSLSVKFVGADVTTIGGVSICEINQIGCAEAQAIRTVSFTSNATVEVSVVLDDPLADHAKYVLAGSELDDAPFVAVFEVTAEFGDVEVEDIILNVDGDTDGFLNGSSEVILYDEQFNVIQSEPVVNGLEVNFNNVYYTFTEGTTKLYVKVISERIGDNYNGMTTDDIQFTLELDDVQNSECDADVGVDYDGVGQTLQSHEFAIVPVSFSNYEFVLSTPGGEYTVDTEVTNSNQRVLAILEVTASEWINLDVVDGSDLDIIMDGIGFSNIPVTYVMNRNVFRMGSTNVLEEIQSGETVYYIFEGDVNLPAGTTVPFSLSFNGDGSDTSIEYSVSDGSFSSSDMRLGIGSIDSPEVLLVGS